MTKVFYKRFKMVAGGATAVSNDKFGKPIEEQRLFYPETADIDTFIKETESWANQNGMHIVSIVPITGGVDIRQYTQGSQVFGHAGSSVTCGLIIVMEGP